MSGRRDRGMVTAELAVAVPVVVVVLALGLSAIRLGFVVPPPWALPAMVAAKNASDWHSAVPIQAAVAGFIEDGHLARHIRRMRRIYLERRERLTKLLRERIGQAVTVVPSSYGMHLTAMARPDVDCEAVSEALAERGIMIHSLARYYLDPAATRGGFILGYAAADLDEIAAAVDALAGMIAGSSSR